MKTPTKIALLSTVIGTLVVVIMALVYRQVGDGNETVGIGAAVGVFVGLLFAATNAAYAQGKKDASTGSATTE